MALPRDRSLRFNTLGKVVYTAVIYIQTFVIVLFGIGFYSIELVTSTIKSGLFTFYCIVIDLINILEHIGIFVSTFITHLGYCIFKSNRLVEYQRQVTQIKLAKVKAPVYISRASSAPPADTTSPVHCQRRRANTPNPRIRNQNILLKIPEDPHILDRHTPNFRLPELPPDYPTESPPANNRLLNNLLGKRV